MKMADILLVVALALKITGFAFIFGLAEPPQALSPHVLARTINGVFDSVETATASLQSTARTVQAESARGMRELQNVRGNLSAVRDALRSSQN